MTEITQDAIKQVFDGIIASGQDELRNITDPADLERYWFWRYNPEYSLEWNTYQFHDMLDLYQRRCRQWEEMHNGRSCVVERVRDRYLMPKIREWLRIVQMHDVYDDEDS